MLELRDGMYFDGDFFLVDWDDATRRAVWVKDGGDEWIVRTDYYAMDTLINHNADFAKADSGKKMGDWVRIASVPQYVADQHQLDEKIRQGDKAAVSRVLNSSDLKKFRTREGSF